MKHKELNIEVLQLVAGRFKLLADPTRLSILNTLGDKEMNVGQLVAATGANQANVSRHLSDLLEAGIVARRKQGLTSNYRIVDETIFEVCDLVCKRLRDHFESRHIALKDSL